MSKTAIVTDSTADLTEEICSKYNISVVPLSVIFEENVYLDDGIALPKEEFYRKLKDAKKLPTTAQPSPADFKKAYTELLTKYDSVVSIHISKKMSGTIDSAELARKEIGGDIEIIDSEMTTIALGLVVMKAAELAVSGAAKEDILKTVYDLKLKVNTLFIPLTLEYLQKGGRIGKAKGLIASLLEIKPILTLHNGEVSQFKTTRRWNQAKNELLDSVQNMVKEKGRLIIAVADADLKEEGDELRDRIVEKFNPKLVNRFQIGCIVGTHLGPGIAIAFYEE